MPHGKDWLWIGVGVVLALFVYPMVTGLVASRKQPKAS